MRALIGLSIAICILLTGAAHAASGDDTRLIMRTKEKDAEFRQLKDWSSCEQQMKFIVITNNKALYEGARARLQKLVGGLRAVTSINCREMTSMKLIGVAGKDVVFAGIAEASNAWRLVELDRDGRGGQSSQQKKPSSGNTSGATPSQPSAKAMNDQSFFAALGRSFDGVGGNLTPPPAPALAPQPPSEPRLVPAPVQGAVLPGTDNVDGETQRNIYAYKKLSADLPQVLGLSSEELSNACAEIENRSTAPEQSRDMLSRLCRAVALSRGDLKSALNFGRNISEK